MRPRPATYHLTQDPPPLARAPSTAHNTSTACTTTRGTAFRLASIRTARAPIAPSYHPVPPTAGHRVPHLCTPTATTDGPALQHKPLGLPGGCTPPHPLPLLRGPQPPPPRAAGNPSRSPACQPPQLPQATHQHPPGLPGRTLRSGPGRRCVDHCHDQGRRAPGPPKHNPTPQRRQLEPGGLPHRPRQIPPPPLPLSPQSTAPSPPGQQLRHRERWRRRHRRRWQTSSGAPAAVSTPLSAGRKDHPAHSRNSSTRNSPPPPPTQLRPPERRPFWTATWPPPVERPPHRWTPHTSAPTSGASRHASERHMAGIPAPRHPHGGRGDHLPPTRTKPRRPRRAKGPASAPANRARRPGRDPGPAASHHLAPKAPGHTYSNTLTNAYHDRCTAAP